VPGCGQLATEDRGGARRGSHASSHEGPQSHRGCRGQLVDPRARGSTDRRGRRGILARTSDERGTTGRIKPADNKAGQPAKKEETSKGKAVSTKGKWNKKGKGKTPKGKDGATAQPEKKEASARKEEGRVASRRGQRHLTPLLTRRPRVGDYKVVVSRKRGQRRG
jgi:hypothetical protein